ncbi:MAG: hypothetical protein KKF20_01030 [Bacteroidetes bacterium]|nr:hypothetical protein [Bacteroidota bacterium]
MSVNRIVNPIAKLKNKYYTKSHARLPSSTIIGGQEGYTKPHEEQRTNDSMLLALCVSGLT